MATIKDKLILELLGRYHCCSDVSLKWLNLKYNKSKDLIYFNSEDIFVRIVNDRLDFILFFLAFILFFSFFLILFWFHFTFFYFELK